MNDNVLIERCGNMASLSESKKEYTILCSPGTEISEDEADGICKAISACGGVVAVSTGGSSFYDKLEKIVFAFGAGKSVPVPSVAVAFSHKDTEALSRVRRIDPVSVTLKAVDSGIPVAEYVTGYYKGGVGAAIKRLFDLFLASHTMKYAVSSLFAFSIDYVLLLLLNSVIPVASMEIAALIAWCVSSLTNFAMNRNFVFHSRDPIPKALAEYFGLAGCVFVLKTYVLLEFLTRIVMIPLPIAKIIAETLFFVLNYFTQKKFVFKSR